jgi:hypothetical protein
MQVSRKTRILLEAVSAAILLFSSIASPAFALTSGDVVSAGSIWLETTIAVAMVFVTAMAFSLQIARGYFLRILNKFTLRLGADIWWLGYVMIRDALLFMSFVMGLMVFFPGTFLDYPMAVPFMPVAVVLFGVALVTKLYFDADDNRNAFRAVTLLVFGGTILWIFGAIFVLETPLALSTLPSGVSSTAGIWAYAYNTFSSTQNLNLAMSSFQVCFAALGVIGVVGFAHPLLHSRIKARKVGASSSPAVTSPVSQPLARAAEPRAQTPIHPSFQAGDITQAQPSSRSREHLDYIA